MVAVPPGLDLSLTPPALTSNSAAAAPAARPSGHAAADRGLGEALVAIGAISAPDLGRAMSRPPDGKPLGEALLSAGLVTKEHLGRAQAMRLGIGVFSMADGVDPSVATLVDSRSMRRYRAVPVRRDPDGRLAVAMGDPGDVVAIDDLRVLAGCDIRPLLASEDDIRALLARSARIDEVVSDLADASEEDDQRTQLMGAEDLDGASDRPNVRFVNETILRAIDERASDIHFEPRSDGLIIRFRVDGVLREIARAPSRVVGGVVGRLKIMASLDIAERRVPQDGRIALNIGGRHLDLRVATLPTVYGEKVVIRVLDSGNIVLNLDDLGFERDVLARYTSCYKKPYGAILVTGPTGSGKSTTLYGTLNQVNDDARNIITVEDPVEYRLGGVNQVQVNVKSGLTFAAGLRSILRCDPDVVMIGEIRDKETAKIAIEAALTGHLVLATLHTNDSAGAISRLTEMGVEPFLSASALTCVLAQRLARKLCPHCKQPVKIPVKILRDAVGGRLPANLPDPVTVFQSGECARCTKGYRGRVGVYELLVMTDEIRKLTLQDASANEIAAQAGKQGMLTLLEDGARKVLKGLTSIDELARAVG